jgi:PIN domain nuclease of toxin-antitoxin system
MSGERYLLDTQIILWDLADDPRLKPKHDNILLGDSPKFLSIATLWEIALKVRLKKLVVPDNLIDVLTASDVQLLPITPEHALHVATLPDHHSDPFDLLIVAQAMMERMVLVTADKQMKKFNVKTV